MLSGIKAVLVDVDGTLLDSNDAHARSWVTAFGEARLGVPFDTVRSLIGKGGDKLLAETVGFDEKSPIAKCISERRGRIFEDTYLRTLKPTNGARDLLIYLRDRGLQIVVATSAEADDVDALLQQAGLADLVDAVVTSSDAEATKPDPDIVSAALRKAAVSADAAVMIGDTPFDVEAASRAGVRSIALRCGGRWSDADLAGAAAIFDDPRALLAALEECTEPFDAAQPAVPATGAAQP